MAPKRLGRHQLDARRAGRGFVQKLGKIFLQMNAHDEKIRHHEDPFGALGRQPRHGLGKARFGQFQERCASSVKTAGLRRRLSQFRDRLVGLGDSRAVSEDDQRVSFGIIGGVVQEI